MMYISPAIAATKKSLFNAKLRRLLCFALLALLLWAPRLVAAAQARPDSIRIVMDDNYPPYSFRDSDGKQQGILIDQWRLWEQRTGIKVEILAMDWGKALSAMKAGEVDVIDTIFKTDERSGWLVFSRPYATLEVPIFFDKDISGITDAASLRGFPVAAKTGDAAVDLLRRNGVDHLVLFNSYEAICLAAKEQKIAVFVVDAPPALYYLHKFGIRDRFKQSAPLDVGQFHRAVKKGNTELLKLVEDGFRQIPATELKKINNKWFGKPLPSNRLLRTFLMVAGSLAMLLPILFAWNYLLRKKVDARTAELKVSIEALHESQELLHRAQSLAHVGHFKYYPSTGLVEGSDELLRIFGLDNNPFQFSDFVNAIHPDERTSIAATLESVIERRIGYEIEFRLLPPDGAVKWVKAIGEYVVALPFEESLLIGAVQDITERKQAEEELLQQKILLSSIIESSTGAIFAKDRAGKYMSINKAGARMLGCSPGDVIGRTDMELLPAETALEFRKTDESVVASGLAYEREEAGVIGNKTYVFLAHKAPWRDTSGNIIGVIGVSNDITERKALEAQLQQAQKMESVGRLAGGVAHDFNNMLGVILGHTELALDQVDASHPLRADLEEIRKAAGRSADLTRQLLAFARKQTVTPRLLDLNETVAGMLKMLQRLIGEDIQLRWQPKEELWPVRVDPSQLDQILANLCINARDAIAGVGKITIETGNSVLDEDYCAAHPGSVPGEFVRLAVSDSGCGMDKETLAHIFEPFFTTKGVSEGTGLGLATVYGAVKQNNGFINAYSEPGQGTTFTICLPRHVGKAGQMHSEGPARPPVRGQETILLVEDEPAILKLTTKMLEKQGYTVLAAATPGEAIRLAREYPGDIGLLMTDVVMPEMNGRDLAKNLQALYPHLRRLFMSGYTADVIAHHGVLDEGVFFLQKPFSTKDLAAKVREVLEQS